ncbi:IS3 family transposase [Paenibacillus sp. 7541]|uniref:IS3 family transposase n=2 Tax=unclassified Paenibacillus TaxID=185978 RepID=UPI00159634E5|nr:IS3 family transposase [Paenibacillus sp. 7541]
MRNRGAVLSITKEKTSSTNDISYETRTFTKWIGISLMIPVLLASAGYLFDNAVAEATYKIMKTESVNQMTFHKTVTWNWILYDYVNWFNKDRIHGTLGYMSLFSIDNKPLILSDLLSTNQMMGWLQEKSAA